MDLGRTAGKFGQGLLAGMIGTAAMTVSSTIEMQLRGREASSTPLKAASKVLGFRPASDADQERLSTLVHWAYGTGWGGMRGLIDASGHRGMKAVLLHFALVWGTELIMLPSLEVTPPVNEWGEEEVAIDALHHTVYVLATSMAYALLRRD